MAVGFSNVVGLKVLEFHWMWLWTAITWTLWRWLLQNTSIKSSSSLYKRVLLRVSVGICGLRERYSIGAFKNNFCRRCLEASHVSVVHGPFRTWQQNQSGVKFILPQKQRCDRLEAVSQLLTELNVSNITILSFTALYFVRGLGHQSSDWGFWCGKGQFSPFLSSEYNFPFRGWKSALNGWGPFPAADGKACSWPFWQQWWTGSRCGLKVLTDYSEVLKCWRLCFSEAELSSLEDFWLGFLWHGLRLYFLGLPCRQLFE